MRVEIGIVLVGAFLAHSSNALGQGCGTPTDAWSSRPFALGFAPPPEGADIRMDVTFKPAADRRPPGIKKHILLRQDYYNQAGERVPWVAARAYSDDGLQQSYWIQSDGKSTLWMEFRECGPNSWVALQDVRESGLAWGEDSTKLTAFEVGEEARFTLTWGTAIARPRLPPQVVVNNDVATAVTHITWAWNDHGPCTRFLLCATYFDSWGVNITFGDGSVVPFAHVQRLTTSAHDCIQRAKDAARKGDRGLAVEWVMASQIHNPPVREWLRTHPDAVIAALSQVNAP